MKENIKKIIKQIDIKVFKIWFLILLVMFIVRESYWLYIDNYNFKQLEKVKIVLKDLKRNDEQFLYLKDFNKIYNQNIKPIKNCYYLRNYKSEDRVPYIFWFKLESLFNIYLYKKNYFAYPKYDIPYEYFLPSRDDINFYLFNKTISNPCQD